LSDFSTDVVVLKRAAMLAKESTCCTCTSVNKLHQHSPLTAANGLDCCVC